jgi:tripartite ATP-independent transporter DctM subunit
MNVGIALITSFLGFICLGIPISFAMGISTMLGLLLGGFKLEMLPLMIQNGAGNISLIAIPYFVLAGNIMNSAGITSRLFNFANATIGFMRGGLAQVNVLASMIFAGISGTATADAAGLGLIEIDAMTKKGYDKPFSVAITLASSVIGPIIPPSVSFIIYAMLAQVSVGKLFIAGIVPGVCVGIVLMIGNYIIAKRGRIAIPEPEKFDPREIVRTFKEGFFALLAPAILLYGLLSGIVTATETGIIAVVYSLIVGMIYKELTPANFREALVSTIKSTAVIMYMIGMGLAIGWLATIEQLPQLASSALLGLTQNKYLMLLIINVILLILGMFLDGNTIKLIMIPLLLPIIDTLGVDRIQFGVITTINALIGMTTPPVGVGLFVMSSITDLKITQVVRAFGPFYLQLLICLFLVTYVPALTLWLPSIVK